MSVNAQGQSIDVLELYVAEVRRYPLLNRQQEIDLATTYERGKAAARRLREIRDTHGPDSIGVLTSAKCLNEDNYLMNKFARQVIGTNNIDHCARL